MKKLFILFSFIYSLCAITFAQDDCIAFFPSETGTVLVNKTYDSNGTLLSSMTYTVKDSYNYIAGTSMNLGFVMMDNTNKVIDNGTISANCNDGAFYLNMKNRALSPEIMKMLSMDTELVGDFLDYPDPFNDNFPFDGDFRMDGGEYTIQSKTNKKDFINVRMYGRNYEKNEQITTPAGTFDAAKVTYNFEVTQNKKSTTYKGTEWYAANAGIVRSETYDNKGNLQNYTVLSTIQKGK